MNRTAIVSVGLALVMLLGSCQKHSSSTPPPVETIKRYFINGDPLTLVSDTKLNNKSFLTADNIDQINGFDVKIFFFSEKSAAAPSDYGSKDQIEKANRPSDGSRIKKTSPHFYLSEITDTSGKISYKYSSPELGNLSFTITPSPDDENVYEFTKVKYERTEEDIKVIHYSHKSDLSAFSLLIYDKNPEQKSLMEFTFMKDGNNPVKSNIADSSYNFLFGPGVKIGWNQSEKFTFSLCGSDSKKFQPELVRAFNDWKTVLKNRLNISVSLVKECPPFSDLNFKGLYFIDNYLTLSSPVAAEPMETISFGNLTNSELIDSDIFVMKKEFQKFLNTVSAGWDDHYLEESNILYRMTLHEFGHVFGLHHQFDGTKSIMSYDSKMMNISDYDRQAINILYPLKNKRRSLSVNSSNKLDE